MSDERCDNCGCPMSVPVKVEGYWACQDCAEAAVGPLWKKLTQHSFRPSGGVCFDCGKPSSDVMHPAGMTGSVPSTSYLLGAK